MNTPEKCPRCGAVEYAEFTNYYSCGSIIHHGKLTEVSGCLRNQRDQLATKLTALESSLRECTPWIPVSEQLPPEGKYVLIHLTKDNWKDDTDPEGVYFKVAKLERGLSLADRGRMQSGDLPDPHGRRFTVTGADEYANNLRPYIWNNFGPGNYFGQEVDYWMDIPKLP